MKSYKLFIESNNIHDKLVDLLQKEIIKDNKIINGFEFYVDPSNGAFEWYDKYYVIRATPYWNGNELPLNISNQNGVDIDFQQFGLKELKDVKDIKETIKFYYKKIDEITKLYNKRSQIKKELEILLKSIENVRIEGYFSIQRGNKLWSDDEIDKLNDNDIDKILKIINKKYSDILTANKFNI